METPGQTEPAAQPPIGGMQPVPNSTAVLVLGILSIVCCCCYGLPGLVLGIIAVVLSGKARDTYAISPGAYTLGSYKNLQAGRVCAIVGICLSALYLVIQVVYLLVWGASMSFQELEGLFK